MINQDMKSIQKICFTLLVGLTVFSFQSCKNKEEEPVQEAEASENTGIETFVLDEQQMQTNIRIPGELIAYNQVDLYAKVNSFVKKLYVDVGSRVQSGTLLATLEAPELNAQYNAQSSNLKAMEAAWISSKVTYDRLLETSKTPGTVSPNDLDVAKAKRDSDYARFESVKASQSEVGTMRQYLEVRAPFSGIITARNVSPGAYVGPSGKGSELPLFSLKEDKKLRLTVGIPQNYVPYLKQGQQIRFTVPTLPGKEFEATISRSAGALDENIRSERIEMDVDNSQGILLPGMIAEVQLSLDVFEKAFIIPKTALLRSTEGYFVIKMIGGKIEWIPVQEGNASEETIEVFGTLKYGDTLVKKASEEIRNGIKLEK